MMDWSLSFFSKAMSSSVTKMPSGLVLSTKKDCAIGSNILFSGLCSTSMYLTLAGACSVTTDLSTETSYRTSVLFCPSDITWTWFTTSVSFTPVTSVTYCLDTSTVLDSLSGPLMETSMSATPEEVMVLLVLSLSSVLLLMSARRVDTTLSVLSFRTEPEV